MSSWTISNEEENERRLVVAITDFLRDQLATRTDLVPEDRDCLEIAVQCLEMAYGLDATGYVQLRFARPLLDIFTQVTNPVSVRDKIRADAHKIEGNNYMRSSMYQEAETEYTNAIELDKWNSIYYCNRAGARIEQQNFFDAIADCRQALILNPDYAKAHAKMGQAYALLNRPRQAARCFRQAVELEPGNDRYRNNLSVAENQTSRPDSMELLAHFLSSVLGIPPSAVQTGTNDDQRINIPPTFMIIAETHPPSTRDDTSPQNVQGTEEETDNQDTDGNERPHIRELVFPRPYGVVDEGSEEKSTLVIADDETNRNADNDQEFVIEVPGLIFIQADRQTPTGEREPVTITEDVNGEQADNQKDDQLVKEDDGKELRTQRPTEVEESTEQETEEKSIETLKYDFSSSNSEQDLSHLNSDKCNQRNDSKTSKDLPDSDSLNGIEDRSSEEVRKVSAEKVEEIIENAKAQQNASHTHSEKTSNQETQDSSESSDKSTNSKDKEKASKDKEV